MLPTGLPPAPAPEAAQSTQIRDSQTLPGGLLVRYDEVQYDFRTQKQIFRGKVEATYGPTVITCSELEIDGTARTGIARGGVRLTDPEGLVEADVITFSWLGPGETADPKQLVGSADSANLTVGNARIWGRRLEIRPSQWTIFDASGTLSRRDKPEWRLTAKKVTLVPGKSGVAERVHLEILGFRIGPLPRYSFSLDRRLEGFTLPSFRNEKGVGYGFGWSSNYPLSDNAVLSGSWSSFPRKAASWGLEFSTSPYTSLQTNALIRPRSDLGERFEEGFFDNIGVTGPEVEDGFLREKRSSWSIGSYWNIGVNGRRDVVGDLSKRLDIAYEGGGRWGSFGLMYQGRAQSIRGTILDEFTERAVGQATISAPTIKLAPNLDLRLRADVFTTLGADNQFAWARAVAGLAYQPWPGVRLGAALVRGGEAGNPDFIFDRLVSTQAVHLRFDYSRGPYTFRYLVKYDFDQKMIYSREYEVAWVAEGFEPFILYRQFPSSYQIGLRFRIDDLRGRLTSRTQNRKGSPD